MPTIDPLAALEGRKSAGLTAEEKARLEKWRKAAAKAHETGKMANTLAKALATRFAARWRFVDFHGPKGHESAGIVDILAVRKCGKDPGVEGLKKLDLFEFQIIQVKGGSASLPTPDEIARLSLVSRRYDAKRIILFEWVKGKRAVFSKLTDKSTWQESTANSLFGPKS